jgi:hypothetical protein
MKTIGMSLLAVCLLGCAADLEAGDGGTTGLSVGERGGPNVVHEEQSEGEVVTRVDATAEETWVYLDLDSGEQLDVADPSADADWDVAFLRFHIKLNGGVSGGADVDALPLSDTAFADVTVAPADGFLTDQADGEDDNEDPDYVFRDWYAYEFMTHVLTPHPIVYVVRTAEPRHFKLQIENYYDDAGSSAHITFRWAEIPGP